MKGITNKQIELARQSIIDAEYHYGWPETEYPASFAAANNWKVWEIEMETYCQAFLAIFGSKGEEAAGHTRDMAGWIGDLIAEQLIAGNFAAPRIVSEGIINLRSGYSWKRSAGRAPSPLGSMIILAFCILQGEFSIKRPSQTDVHDFLSKHGLEVSKDRLSKYFKKLGLMEHADDGREAESAAGKRRRRKA